jgi:uncharacterized membrane protein YeiH
LGICRACCKSDIYATAALGAAVLLILTRRLGASPIVAAFSAGGFCFVLRVVAAALHWNLPRIAKP